MPVRTFVDTGVLIAAFRGDEKLRSAAEQVLDDPDRVFVTSDFVSLELLPKARYNKHADEVAFYQTFLAASTETVHASETLIADAHTQAAGAGLAAMDALHVAAARQANAAELVTAERPTKPMFRVGNPTVRSIRPVKCC
ncbi:MAG: type II toxin-antitoxin system VapC family toxin [Phycisphaerae bacterium]|jgi:predicted nucleic acid-binding protein